ncbi:MAG TPA: phosphate ABC transporter ATP-binding protein [Sneathiellales bacterium]|jgi:tungstate transport system ATP-binding protein|nr:phosphate ABC transporter ATP-binding protein [Sneathiellales bacterium]
MVPGILPLEVRRVSLDMGSRRLLDDLNFTVKSGSFTIILGPNGAGKSLTLRLCHGLLRPTVGEVLWRGIAAREVPKHQTMVFQRPMMLRRSVTANIEYGLRLQGMGRRQRRERIAEVLKLAGLEALAGRAARSLSIGEQQRVAIARAWALRPQVLFLDEPAANLDPSATRAIEGVLRAVHNSGTKIVMSTHDLPQAKRLADEILFLHRGRLLEQSSADTFFDNPVTTEAQAFVEGELLW